MIQVEFKESLIFFMFLKSLIISIIVGDNDGRILGRRYFQCKNSHGIFLTANEVRFARNNSMRK